MAKKTAKHTKETERVKPAKKAASTNKTAAKKASGRSQPKTADEGAGDAKALIRIYRHGLGDCILVRVPRKKGPMFKLLIDCGVAVAQAQGAEKMKAVMKDILDITGGSVDVLAVTHEHWDHVSGFQ